MSELAEESLNYDDWDETNELLQDVKDTSKWVDVNYKTHDISKMPTSHLLAIIKGISKGNHYYGQVFKQKYIIQELRTRGVRL